MARLNRLDAGNAATEREQFSSLRGALVRIHKNRPLERIFVCDPINLQQAQLGYEVHPPLQLVKGLGNRRGLLIRLSVVSQQSYTTAIIIGNHNFLPEVL